MNEREPLEVTKQTIAADVKARRDEANRSAHAKLIEAIAVDGEEPLGVQVARIMGCTPILHKAGTSGIYGVQGSDYWSCGCGKNQHDVNHDGADYGTLECFTTSGDGLLRMLEWAKGLDLNPTITYFARWIAFIGVDDPLKGSERAYGDTPGEALAKAILLARAE